jgi:hypothetical protein
MITTALFLTENLAEGVLPCSQICYTEITTVNSLLIAGSVVEGKSGDKAEKTRGG